MNSRKHTILQYYNFSLLKIGNKCCPIYLQGEITAVLPPASSEPVFLPGPGPAVATLPHQEEVEEVEEQQQASGVKVMLSELRKLLGVYRASFQVGNALLSLPRAGVCLLLHCQEHA